MIELFLWTFIAATPAFVANMSPVFAKKLSIWKSLDYPVDFKKSLLKKRITGNNKTFRGLLIGTIAGFLVSSLLYFLVPHDQIPFTYLNNYTGFAIFGALAGFGALVGDILESIIKRQLNIASGRPFIPFDQIDYILGFLLFTWIYIPWQWEQIVFLLIFTTIFHPLTNIIGYLLGIKNTYW